MLKFKNVGLGVHAQKPVDRGGQLVEAGGVLEVDGEVTTETEDAYIVGDGGEARAWPKAQWELVKPAAKAASVKEQ